MPADRFVIFIGSLKKGGAERNAALLSNFLVQNGHAVDLVMFIHEITFELDPRVNITIINHKRFGNAILNALYVVYMLRGIVSRLKPKRLIAMSRVGSLLATSVMFRNTMVRFDIYPLIGYKTYKKWQFWLFYNMPWVKYVVCPSEELRQDVSPYFLNKKKLVTIYNPVPVPPRQDASSAKAQGRPYFAVVARLNRQKNIAQIIKTFEVSGLSRKIDLLVFGDGPEKSNLEALISSLGLTGKVRLMGFIKDPYPHIRDAYALISASLREGFPNVVVEALSLGTPVLVSAAKTGPREIIFEGENGFLFPVGSYDKLAELMKRIVDSPEMYAYLKKNTGKGLDRFSQAAVTGAWNAVLMAP